MDRETIDRLAKIVDKLILSNQDHIYIGSEEQKLTVALVAVLKQSQELPGFVSALISGKDDVRMLIGTLVSAGVVLGYQLREATDEAMHQQPVKTSTVN